MIYSILIILTPIKFIKDIYQSKPKLIKANADDENASFMNLDLSMHNDTVSSKIYKNEMI